MRCFYHRDAEAIGLCKSCGRGICGECTVEYPEGLACRGRCERAVTEVIALIGRNRRAVVGSGRAVYMFPAFFTIVGFMFVVAGFVMEAAGVFAFALGAVFMALGIAYAIWVMRVQRDK